MKISFLKNGPSGPGPKIYKKLVDSGHLDNRTTTKTRKIDSFSEFIVMSKWKLVVYVEKLMKK